MKSLVLFTLLREQKVSGLKKVNKKEVLWLGQLWILHRKMFDTMYNM